MQQLKHSFLLLLTFISLRAMSQTHYTMTDDMRQAYELAMSLRHDEAKEAIAHIQASDPDNLLRLHVENYLDFFTIFIQEEKSTFKQLEKNKKKRINQLNDGAKDNPWYRFVKAEILLQWALARSKFDQKYRAASEVYSAYKILEENNKQYPDFDLNKKSLSILHALAESLPGYVRTIFGVDGSIEKGTDEIAYLAKQDQEQLGVFYDEVTTIYAYILLFQNNKKQQAWEVIQSRPLGTESNPLACFVQANIAQKNGLNDEAISILQHRPSGAEFADFHYLDFILGKAKLNKLEPDAQVYIQRFIDNFQGQHFIKEAYQKLAWYELLINDDLLAYKKYMKLCADNGQDLVDEDKQAHREAKNKEIPNPELLKARLLYDGGYYQRAYTQLVTKAYLFDTESHDYLEYNYRMGRIAQALNSLTDALQYYGYAINLDKKGKSYMSCNAALQMALIYESQGGFAKAYSYLEKCLDLNPDKYKDGLHQKAKTAKERVGDRLN